MKNKAEDTSGSTVYPSGHRLLKIGGSGFVSMPLNGYQTGKNVNKGRFHYDDGKNAVSGWGAQDVHNLKRERVRKKEKRKEKMLM